WRHSITRSPQNAIASADAAPPLRVMGSPPEQSPPDAVGVFELAVEPRRRAIPEAVSAGGAAVAVEQFGRASRERRPGRRKPEEHDRQEHELLHHAIPPDSGRRAPPCGLPALPALARLAGGNPARCSGVNRR